MEAGMYEVIALDRKGYSVESIQVKELHSAKNYAHQYLNRKSVQWVQVWAHDSNGNATLHSAYTNYLGRAVQVKEID